jgi:hypothetical protein
VALAAIIALVLGSALWLGLRPAARDDAAGGRGRRSPAGSSAPSVAASSEPEPAISAPEPRSPAPATTVPACAVPEPTAAELLAQADAAYAAHRLTDAEALVLRAKTAGAPGREWRIRIAEIAFERRNFDLARREVLTLVEANPNNRRAVRLLEKLGER